jgi:hypothetical protein
MMTVTLFLQAKYGTVITKDVSMTQQLFVFSIDSENKLDLWEKYKNSDRDSFMTDLFEELNAVDLAIRANSDEKIFLSLERSQFRSIVEQICFYKRRSECIKDVEMKLIEV